MSTPKFRNISDISRDAPSIYSASSNKANLPQAHDTFAASTTASAHSDSSKNSSALAAAA